jgi:WD40 repeat protein
VRGTADREDAWALRGALESGSARARGRNGDANAGESSEVRSSHFGLALRGGAHARRFPADTLRMRAHTGKLHRVTPTRKLKSVLWACALAAILGAGLAGCDTKQIGAPVLTGVQWTRITNSTTTPFPYFPDWRGDSLTFIYFNSSNRARIAISHFDGTSLTYLPPGKSTSDDLTPRWVDDTTIVFCSSRDTTSNSDIWYYTTTTQQIMTLGFTPEREWDAAPRPGSDGLVYTEGTERIAGRITLIPEAHSNPLVRYYLTPASLSASEPGWDPTGQTVCFSADSTNSANPKAPFHHLFVVSLADTVPRQITTGPFRDHYPHFSPDGTRILFVSNDRTGRNGLWTIDPSGDQASIRLVTFEDTGKAMQTPCWSPDGTRIIVSSNGHNYGEALYILSDLP